MRYRRRITRKIVVMGLGFALLLLNSGCGGETFTYVPENELKPGQGLFSGEDGEFHLIKPSEEEKQEKPSEQSSPE